MEISKSKNYSRRFYENRNRYDMIKTETDESDNKISRLEELSFQTPSSTKFREKRKLKKTSFYSSKAFESKDKENQNIDDKSDPKISFTKPKSQYYLNREARIFSNYHLVSTSINQNVDQNNKMPTEIRKSDFILIKSIGKGKFGRINLMMHRTTKSLYALKILRIPEFQRSKITNQVMNEIKIQSFIKHPNSTKLYSFFNFENDLCLILEYCPNGNLYEKLKSQVLSFFIKKPSSLEEKLVAHYIKQILDILIYLHTKGIIHRDLKPENILLSFVSFL